MAPVLSFIPLTSWLPIDLAGLGRSWNNVTIVYKLLLIFFPISFVDFYNKAVEIAPMISPGFASDVAEGECWSKNHLRSYFRAVHGQANTLRKMGRYKEALEKYLLLEKLDPEFHKYEMRIVRSPFI